MDMRLLNGAVFQIVGPSGCGKSHFVVKLLASHRNIFQKPINNIYWLMGSNDAKGRHVDVADTQLELNKLKNLHILKGFELGWQDKPKRGDVCVIDDLFMEANNEHNFNNMFTKVARHREVTVIFVTQNLFHQGGQHRTRNLNTHYLVIFKNPRDSSVIEHLARQAFPSRPKYLVEAYHDATRDKPHGYIFLDFTQSCPDVLRVRSDILNTTFGIIVYKQSDVVDRRSKNTATTTATK